MERCLHISERDFLPLKGMVMNTERISDPIRTLQQTTETLSETILEGGDERLHLLSNGLNKYNVNPVQFQGILNRGSCTCSPFTPDGYAVALDLLRDITPATFPKFHHEHTQRLKELLNFEGEDRFDVFFAPSGSDLCYYPLLFSQMINPGKKIVNLVTCPEELGSGSTLAMNGQYYFQTNQIGKTFEKGAHLTKTLDISRKDFPARGDMGRIINHQANILETIQELGPDYSIIANLVIGSKSGIENNTRVISQVPESVMWTVDLCQFRASRLLVNGLLGQNCMVLITGSKFYQAPPFCGALLVPRTITNRFKYVDPDLLAPFHDIFTKYDFPVELRDKFVGFPEKQNVGLMLRWEAALNEMEKFDNLCSFEVHSTCSDWNDFVRGEIKDSPQLELMPDQELTSPTIISFRVKNRRGEYLSYEQLRDLYQTICSTEHEGFSNATKVLFGQPVRYGEKSFIRLAIGSHNIRQFVEQDVSFEDDRRIVEIINEFARDYR